ncbi:class II aldolase/adducin N-terminal [Aspergillus caelatus]|uniref:Class II aldolase/adducin N-terminal n=1 Tax=Aspergillus caelatus TaxID=61420 RepID=A0A5N6ZVX1_9EURO|nr:class II aldolase/adducin N-terminal [Aspergillus caelatus]KAE8361089.1 class II aldolase/adducin N-terminal [Aspergillus caelatus]
MSPATVMEDPIHHSQANLKTERPGATPSIPPDLTSSWRQDVHFLGDKDGKVELRSPPTFNNISDTRTHLKQHLAAAFRVFARQGFNEGHSPSTAPSTTPDPDLNAACHAHSVYGKAFSCFGRPIEMLHQDALRFYNDLAVYPRYGGTVLTTEEGDRIAAALGPTCRSVILQNHGMITCGRTVDEAAFLFITLDRCCHAQLLANAAVCPGFEKKYIPDEQAEFGHRRSGNANKMWLAFQPYYEQVVKEEPGLLL